MEKEGRQLVMDVGCFELNIHEFCKNPRNVEDIKNRSFDFAENCEYILK